MQQKKLCRDRRLQSAEKRRHAPEGTQSCTKKQKVAIKVVSKLGKKMIAVYTAAELNAEADGRWSKRTS